MTDELADLHAKADALLSLLAARAHEDIAGAVMPGQTYEARVSGTAMVAVDPDDPNSESVPLSSTERAVDRLADAPTYQRVVTAFRDVISTLTDTHDRITPTGRQCSTAARDLHNGQLVRCERLAVRWKPLVCELCWRDIRHGLPPDVDIIRDRNARLTRDCECTSSDCPHAPGRCLNRIPPGVQARTCGTCRNRRSQAGAA